MSWEVFLSLKYSRRICIEVDFSSVQFSRSVVSDSLWPHESRHTRPPCASPSPGFIQTHVHRVGDAIQPSHPLSSHFPPAPNPSQHQSFISPQMPHGNHLWRHWSIVDFVEKLLTMTLIYLIDVGLFRLCISSWMDFNSLYILKSFSFPPRHKLYWHNIFVILFIMFLILKNLY